METHMVKPIFLAFSKQTHPRFYVRRRITSLWKAAVLHRSTQTYRLAVELYLPVTDADLTHSEGDRDALTTILHLSGVEIWV